MGAKKTQSGHGTCRALRRRNFRVYIGGLAVSLAGTWMRQLARSWLVYRRQREWGEWLATPAGTMK